MIFKKTAAERLTMDPEISKPIGRRVILSMGAVGVAGIAYGSKIQSWVGSTLSKVAPNNSLIGLIPGADTFQIYTVAGFPQMSTSQYKLSVNGLVKKELSFTYEELLSFKPTLLTKDFQCVTGWRVPNVHFKGVALKDILSKAEPKNNANYVLFHSFDGVYTESLSIDQAMRFDVIVAYSMLGGPITEEHGGPVRLYVAPMYGYKSIKWLSEITLSSSLQEGYWEQLGYDVNAWIGNSNGRNDRPVD